VLFGNVQNLRSVGGAYAVEEALVVKDKGEDGSVCLHFVPCVGDAFHPGGPLSILCKGTDIWSNQRVVSDIQIISYFEEGYSSKPVSVNHCKR
jgi:hypothetical protein